MKMIKVPLRYLLSSMGLFFVVWPVISLLFLSAAGLSILLLNAGPSVVEPIMNQIWPSGIVGISVATVLIGAGVFTWGSYSLRRLGLFVLAAYSFTLVFGLASLFILGIFFDTSGPSPNVSNATDLSIDFVLSLFVFLIANSTAYALLYRNGYSRLKATVATTLNRQ